MKKITFILFISFFMNCSEKEVSSNSISINGKDFLFTNIIAEVNQIYYLDSITKSNKVKKVDSLNTKIKSLFERVEERQDLTNQQIALFIQNEKNLDNLVLKFADYMQTNLKMNNAALQLIEDYNLDIENFIKILNEKTKTEEKIKKFNETFSFEKNENEIRSMISSLIHDEPLNYP